MSGNSFLGSQRKTAANSYRTITLDSRAYAAGRFYSSRLNLGILSCGDDATVLLRCRILLYRYCLAHTADRRWSDGHWYVPEYYTAAETAPSYYNLPFLGEDEVTATGSYGPLAVYTDSLFGADEFDFISVHAP